MPIKFYNTASKKKEDFHPLEKGIVKLYTCGPTVYDHAHIGNFRTFLFEDFLKRFLNLKGFTVRHIMNITDVDDKTINRAREEKMSLAELTGSYSDFFFEDCISLKVLPADEYPTATGHVESMIDLIKILVDKGHAYQAEDQSVYFAIDSFSDYGQLARLDLSKQRSAERNVQDDYSKDRPQDFALWKAWKTEDFDVSWDSPWGKGRPGWHIECSAMSMQYLGHSFDIHCGGTDNIFPHHENELAQSVCATGESFVNFWMHSEHLLVDGGKMSKSQGNYYRLSDLLQKGISPEAVRFALLNGHYRSRLNFTLEKAEEATQVVQRVCDFSDRLRNFNPGLNPSETNPPDEYGKFVACLDDDLDVPKALAVFFDWLRKTNSKIDNGKITEKESRSALQFVTQFNSLFQILPGKIEIPENVREMVEKREIARSKQDWSTADKIRDEILVIGWTVEDTPQGPKPKPI